jgi:hypothetical protein
VLHRKAYFPLAAPVRRVIAGHRMEPALFDALNFMCHKKGIQFNRTGIGDEGIDADYVKPPKDDAFVVRPATQTSRPTSAAGRKH